MLEQLSMARFKLSLVIRMLFLLEVQIRLRVSDLLNFLMQLALEFFYLCCLNDPSPSAKGVRYFSVLLFVQDLLELGAYGSPDHLKHAPAFVVFL